MQSKRNKQKPTQETDLLYNFMWSHRHLSITLQICTHLHRVKNALLSGYFLKHQPDCASMVASFLTHFLSLQKKQSCIRIKQ